MKVIIRWTDRETNEVIASAAKAMADTNCSAFEALKEGQKVLHKDRQKSEGSLRQITLRRSEKDSNIVGDIEYLSVKLLKEKKARESVTQELVKSIPEVQELLSRFREEVRVAFDEVIEQETRRAEAKLAEALKDLKSEQSPTPAQVQVPVKPKKKKVLVIGMRPDQQQKCRTNFPDLDLRFVHTEYGKIKAQLKGADWVVLWVKFSGHNAEDLCKTHEHYLRAGTELQIYDYLTKISSGDL